MTTRTYYTIEIQQIRYGWIWGIDRIDASSGVTRRILDSDGAFLTASAAATDAAQRIAELRERDAHEALAASRASAD